MSTTFAYALPPPTSDAPVDALDSARSRAAASVRDGVLLVDACRALAGVPPDAACTAARALDWLERALAASGSQGIVRETLVAHVTASMAGQAVDENDAPSFDVNRDIVRIAATREAPALRDALLRLERDV